MFVAVSTDALQESTERFRLTVGGRSADAAYPLTQLEVDIVDGLDAPRFGDGFGALPCLP